tara:strand:+ start:902 stop:1087 length:186 start_codon:yes stop_codon:yes gene_type:complete
MKDGPFKQAFEGDLEGVIRQELITYKVENGLLKRIVVTRQYHESTEDYMDSSASSPIATMH